MAIKLPFNLSKATQAVIATLSAVGAAGTAILHAWAGFLSPDVSATVTSILAGVAAVAGFLTKAEPIIDDLS